MIKVVVLGVREWGHRAGLVIEARHRTDPKLSFGAVFDINLQPGEQYWQVDPYCSTVLELRAKLTPAHGLPQGKDGTRAFVKMLNRALLEFNNVTLPERARAWYEQQNQEKR